MLPTNSGHAKDKGCSPVSSNCVVWQGPDLSCIELCHGDTVSTVIANMAIQLCIIIEQFKLEEYDFSCLAIPNSEEPDNLAELIQILIERICLLEGIVPGSTNPSSADCPVDCIVNIESCFEFQDPATGDTVTTLPLIDYVTNIANKICDIIDDVNILQGQFIALDDQINGVGGIEDQLLELSSGKASKDSLQYQVNVKTDGIGDTLFITNALRAVENSLNLTQESIGSSNEQYQNIIKEGNIGTEPKTFGIGNMNGIGGWTDTVQNTAESLGNIWLAVSDLRNAVTYIQENCCSTGCSDITLNFRTTLVTGPSSTLLTIYTDGSTGFTGEWKECKSTTRVTISDTLGNSTTINISLIDLISNPAGYQLELNGTSIDTTTNITTTADTCFENTVSETTCEKEYVSVNKAEADCPALTITIYATAVAYQFLSDLGFSYIVNVYYAGGSRPVATQIVSLPTAFVSNSISQLIPDTNYEIEVVVVNTSGVETPCAKEPFTTLATNCTPPINSSAILTTP
jgi:hypothetical protein